MTLDDLVAVINSKRNQQPIICHSPVRTRPISPAGIVQDGSPRLCALMPQNPIRMGTQSAHDGAGTAWRRTPPPDPCDRAAAPRRAPRSHRGGVEPSERKPSRRSRDLSKARLGRGETRRTRRMVCAPSRRGGRQAACRKGVAIQPTGLRQDVAKPVRCLSERGSAFHLPAPVRGRGASYRAIGFYRSGRSPNWLKFKNPAAPAVKREAERRTGADSKEPAQAPSSLLRVVPAPLIEGVPTAPPALGGTGGAGLSRLWGYGGGLPSLHVSGGVCERWRWR